jgi:hypothetical protein
MGLDGSDKRTGAMCVREPGIGGNGLGGLVAWFLCCGGAHGERRESTLVHAPGCYIYRTGAIKM